MDKNKKVLLHFSLISGIGSIAVLKLIKKLYDDFCKKHKNHHIQLQTLELNLEQFYFYKIKDFVQNFDLTEKQAKLLFDGLLDKSKLEKEIELIDKYKISIFSLLDPEYPDCLKQIYMPPIILYCKGLGLGSFEKNFAIVGARKAGAYAEKIVKEIVPTLVNKNFTIVSGGALGADSMAHKAALDSGGKTIVVLGSGLLDFYPKTNKELFKKIVAQNGTLVSPFPLLTPPDKGNFPARNRIIAGLSKACLVVQAAKKSGALITAKFALDEGRTVFAIPGSIFDELSLGCHELINQGAKLVNSTEDIFEDFGIKETLPVCDTVSGEASCEVWNEPYEKQTPANTILNLLQQTCSLDELSFKTKLDLSHLQDLLFDLQLAEKVKQNINGFWERV
ncbi:MAG: DNA-processing protein DprA [Candidatus Babeliales bacterium]